MSMSASELDRYAKACGIDTGGTKSIKAKVALIEESRERTVDIAVCGMTVTVPMRNLHDKRIGDRIERGALNDNAEAERLMIDLCGQDQWEAIIERCTEDDGVVDIDALGLIIASVVTSGKLKN